MLGPNPRSPDPRSPPLALASNAFASALLGLAGGLAAAKAPLGLEGGAPFGVNGAPFGVNAALGEAALGVATLQGANFQQTLTA